jgi:glutathione S-transferase/GST-like protein
MNPIELYYWPTPNGWKITIALEEMGLPYVLRPVNIGTGEQFKPEFLALSPNNRMPAIVDPAAPDGRPVSVFESGAILQYLARKTGQFYGSSGREATEIDQWLFWQMGGLGPMAGQAHHFRQYATAIEPDPEKLAYGVKRYTNEVARLYGVLNKRLADRDFVAGPLSIADFAIWPWVVPHTMQGQDLNDFPNLKAWFERCGARPGFKGGKAAGAELRSPTPLTADDEAARKAREILFGRGQQQG